MLMQVLVFAGVGHCPSFTDGDAGAFVENLDAEDLHRGRRPLRWCRRGLMSKSRIWSEYQGLASSLKPETKAFCIPERLSTVAPAGRRRCRG